MAAHSERSPYFVTLAKVASADQLDAWAGSFESSGLLPELIARLIVASVSPTSIRFPSGKSVYRSGLDGRLVSKEKCDPFFPQGQSYWEISTDGDEVKKLERDYKKRTKGVPRGERSETTFICVTPHKVSRVDEWAIEKSKESDWAHVSVIEAESLALWLSRHPLETAWLGAKMGLPIPFVLSAASAFDDEMHACNRPFPKQVLLAGQASFSSELALWLSSENPDRTLLVSSTSQRDSFLVLLGALNLSADDPDSDLIDLWGDRAIVVSDESDFRFLRDSIKDRPALFVVKAPGSLSSSFFAPGIHRVVIPIGPKIPDGFAGRQTLHVQPRAARVVEDALVVSGLTIDEARSLALETGGEPSAIQGHFGFPNTPAWVTAVPTQHLAALLLAGGADMASRADIDHLSTMIELGESDIEDLLRKLSEMDSSPITRRGTLWTWNRPAAQWSYLSARIEKSLIERFISVSKSVFSSVRWDVLDPGAETIPTHNHEEEVSDSLRQGLATSLVLFTRHRSELHGGVPSIIRDTVIQDAIAGLLPNGWKAWASLNDVLPLFAEAAPDEFLRSFRESLASGKEGVAFLFRKQHPIFGRGHHVGVVRALQVLAWQEATFVRAVQSLLELATIDSADNYHPRPLGALAAIFNIVTPQTTVTGPERLTLLLQMGSKYKSIVWKLLLSSIAGCRGGIVETNTQPIASLMPPPIPERVNVDAALAAVESHAHALLGLADTDPGLVAELVRDSIRGPEVYVERILLALEQSTDAIRTTDVEALVWSALRQFLYHARLVSFEGDAPLDRFVPRAAALYERLQPSDLPTRSAWLFSRDIVLPDGDDVDWQAAARKKRALARNAIEECFNQPDPIAITESLIEKVEEPYFLGLEFGLASAFDKINWDIAALGGSKRGRLFIGGLLRGEIETGRTGRAAEVLEQAFVTGPKDLALELAYAFPPTSWLWDLVRAAGKECETSYWTGLPRFVPTSIQDAERAVETLILNSRFDLAIVLADTFVGKEGGRVSIDVVRRLLETFANAAPPDKRFAVQRDVMGAYHIERLFCRLDAEAGLEAEALATLEAAYLPALLAEGARPHRSLAAIYSLLERDPEWFVSFVSMLARPDGADDREQEAPTPEQVAGAEMAFHVVRSWTSYPGAGLADVSERESTLRNWIKQVLALACARSIGRAAWSALASVLARVPPASDGHWPCLVARELLEDSSPEDFPSRLRAAKYNLRGFYTSDRTNGGQQEHKLAAGYRASAFAIEARWPGAASVLRSLAETYERQAAFWDDDATRDGFQV